MCSPEDPFSCPPALLVIRKTPISAFFSSQNPTFAHKITNFQLHSLKLEMRPVCSEASDWTKIQFTRLYFAQKFSSLRPQIRWWSVYRPLCLAFWAIIHLYQNKSWVLFLPPPPPIGMYTVLIWFDLFNFVTGKKIQMKFLMVILPHL